MLFSFYLHDEPGTPHVNSRFGELFLRYAAQRGVRDESLRRMVVDELPGILTMGDVFLYELTSEGRDELRDAMDELWRQIEAGEYDFGSWIRQHNTQVRLTSDLIRLRRMLHDATAT
jgi:hypothetical protein